MYVCVYVCGHSCILPPPSRPFSPQAMQGVLESPAQPLLNATFFPCLETVVDMTQVSSAAASTNVATPILSMRHSLWERGGSLDTSF